MNFSILYEDNHIIVVYKEAGILVQGDISGDIDLLSEIKEYIKKEYNKPGNVYLGLVHRLDRNTSGVMVFAKTSKAASRLSEQIKEHKFSKKYLCVCEGRFTGKATLKDYLYYDEKKKKSYVVDASKGKEAILDYEVLDTINLNNKAYTLVKVDLKTGRHHQIRCQLANLGYPIYGDVKYGAHDVVGNYYALQSYELSFFHPTTKENLVFRFCQGKNIFKSFGSNVLDKYKLGNMKD